MQDRFSAVEDRLTTLESTSSGGVPGYEVVLEICPIDGSVVKSVLARCPEGKQVLGGGITGMTGTARVIESAPDSTIVDGEQVWNLWEGRGEWDLGGDPWRLQVLAICADTD